MTAPDTRRWLLHTARRALADALGVDEGVASPPLRPEDPVLSDPVAVFVSWHDGPGLLGCIGTMEARRPLESCVQTYAVQAGLHDPRTRGATADRLPHLTCEISILGQPTPIPAMGTAAIADALVPGRDGLVIRVGDRRAVFLPVVWQMLPEPGAFVAALCRKAGIDPALHGEAVRGETFAAEKFGDGGVAEDLRDPPLDAS